MTRLLIVIIILQACVSIHLITGYEVMNDKLQRVNDTLLASCVSGSFTKAETIQYDLKN